MSSRVLRTMILTLLLTGPGGALLAATEDSKPPATPTGAPADGESVDVSKILQEAWPDRPEWLDMYTSILNDESIGPKFGWFRTVVTQTRFDWDATRKRFDRDGDRRIARQEYPGRDADFARLDRDHDGALTPADFDFSSSNPSRNMSRSDQPSKAVLIRVLFRQEIGSLQPGPKLDEPAPDFTLRTYDGKADITLSKQIGPKPIVLIFGNFTCDPFRRLAGNLEELYHRYGDRASFLMVYVRETHPTDGWRMESNDRADVAIAQPSTYAERSAVAQRCGKLLGLGFPLLVDTIDDAVGGRYSGMPSRLYIIDREGKIAFKNARGPYGFKPDELETSLVLLLQDESSGSGARPPTHVTHPAPKQIGH